MRIPPTCTQGDSMMQTDEARVPVARQRRFPGVNVAHELRDRHGPARVALTFADAMRWPSLPPC